MCKTMLHSIIWRNRDHNITDISPGQGYSVGVDSIVGQNLSKHNLLTEYYLGCWITKDLRMSKLNRFMRVKTFSVFLDHLVTKLDIAKNTRHNLRQCYDIVLADPQRLNHIDYEQFSYDIIHTDQGVMGNSVANEIWPLLRMLWRTRGAYTAEIRFDPEFDLAEFGEGVACPITAVYRFNINAQGAWTADFDISYQQPPFTAGIPHKTPDQPWCAIDFGRNNRNSAIRARRLARPDLTDPAEGFNDGDWARIMAQHEQIKDRDLSFHVQWQGQGYWGSKPRRSGMFAEMLVASGHQP